jgi:uncharacterized protein
MNPKRRKPKKGLVIRRSIAGLGIFTTQPIKKGSFIIEYFGKIISTEKADQKGGLYLFDIDEKLTIDGTTRKNTARYINHSCRPNCEPELVGKKIFIYAIKNIKPGEELTYDYGKDYFGDLIKPKGCKCHHCKKKK